MAKQNTVFKDAFNRCLELFAETTTLPSEPELGQALGVSRTTVRAILTRCEELSLIAWDKRSKTVLRRPEPSDYFPTAETDSLAERIERSFMRRILAGGAEPGMQINELELAREIGAGTTSVREFLIRFSRFGLIEKRPNSHWVLKGFTREFALELTEVREMFELRSAARFVSLPDQDPAWEELKKIEAVHREILADIDNRYSEFSELDERLHLLVHKSSSNRFIIDFYDVIAIVFHYHYQWNKANARERNARALEEHLDYIVALQSRDPMLAEQACRRHLKSARETLLQSIS
ncbi:GntR family transcriptional regulator [Sinorhizobium meliloti WSM1022]|jgi:DNA-binding GntR family transcriptional regulator|uniref:GntR family transcriptional regulator n=1 Tax=Rhizobium meliloti TaxID=382 RepID=UPI00041FEB65|nr:GntR family transcriptional regulator [Sinorhizobium meliloti]ASQ05595.1 GntR family transcriptional regulator [Sinorhizobium meliloti]MCO6424069.1 GntR family transcriptional regulator [Sinorhizobium meliloti]MDW9411856.1 FCD domain-containing protein [Sinorhizobium meliloti]MDW9445880.1 FCD domain-containing protein [Sinorhizobium meliloti]MDW9457449.1 FCD domain-containing protein [Sinorhizobium meliloti]